MRVILFIIMLGSFLFSYEVYELPRVKIAFFDSNNTQIKPSKTNHYNRSSITIKAIQKAYVKIYTDKFFTKKGEYFFILNGAKAKGCSDTLLGSVCHFDFNGEKEFYRYDIQSSWHQQIIRGAVVYYPYQFLNYSSKINQKNNISYFVIGLLVAIVLYALIVGLFLKESIYIYYALMEFSFLLYLIIRVDLLDLASFTNIVWAVNALTLALLTLFAIKFLKNRAFKELKCFILLYGVFIYALISTVLFIFGIYHYFLGSIALPIVIYCALKGVKGSIEVKLFLTALIVIFVGVVYIEFFQDIWIKHIHPALFVMPTEAIIMLIAIGFYLKRINQERLENRELLIHTNKEKNLSLVVASIAHKYKNSLNRLSYIIINTQLGTTPKEEALQDISTEIESLKTDTNNYLSLYQNNINKKESKNLKELFELIIKTVDDKDVNFSLDIDKNAVSTKAWAVKEIALIVINNAMEQLKDKDMAQKTINIKLENNYIYICDNAKGAKDISALFKPNHSTKASGSGIGLYIAKTIAKEYLNGNIYAKNSKDGLCIYFEI